MEVRNYIVKYFDEIGHWGVLNGFEAVKEELSFAIFSVERDTDKTDDSISEAKNFARIKKCIQAARLAKSIKCTSNSFKHKGLVNSVTRLGYFWKFSGKNFLTKVAQISIYLCNNVKNVAIKIKTDAAIFWASFVKGWATFYFIVRPHCLSQTAWKRDRERERKRSSDHVGLYDADGQLYNSSCRSPVSLTLLFSTLLNALGIVKDKKLMLMKEIVGFVLQQINLTCQMSFCKIGETGFRLIRSSVKSSLYPYKLERKKGEELERKTEGKFG